MWKIAVATLALTAVLCAAFGQAPDPRVEAATQAFELFAGSCLRFAGDMAGLRTYLIEQNAHERMATERTVGGVPGGIAYDSITDVTRLTLTSLDDGACHVFVERADVATIAELVEEAIKRPSVTVTERHETNIGYAHTTSYEITIGDRRFTLRSSDMAFPNHPSAALSLAPMP